jgi:hypothetical protein
MKTAFTKATCLLIAVLASLLQIPGFLYAGGDKVVLFLQNRSVVIGELLSVREQELVLSTNVGWTDEELSRNPGPICCVPKDDIREVKVKRPSYKTLGIGIGAIAGCVVGAVIAASNRSPSPMAPGVNPGEFLAIAGGSAVVGGIAGAWLGMSISNGDIIAVTAERRGFALLRGYARFPNAEPEFMRAIP